MDKKTLRHDLFAKRNSILAIQRKDKSASIKERLQELEIYQEAYTVFYYVSFGSEVNTHALIKEALHDKRVAVPLVDDKNLLAKRITAYNQLKTGYKGILEPSYEAESINLADIDLIVVPALAYDKRHYRLGYGGGYYDRLLATGLGAPISIGLAFEEQIVKGLPVEAHDQKVDFVVTEKRII